MAAGCGPIWNLTRHGAMRTSAGEQALGLVLASWCCKEMAGYPLHTVELLLLLLLLLVVK